MMKMSSKMTNRKHPSYGYPSKNQGSGKQNSALRPPGSGSLSGMVPPPGRPPKLKENTKKSRAERLLTGSIFATAAVMGASLFVYFRPVTKEELLSAADSLRTFVTEFIQAPKPPPEETVMELVTEDPETTVSESAEEISHMSRTTELGDISDMDAEPVFPPQDTIYSCMLDTAMGPLLYYNQGDIRWKDYLYGGADRIAKYGCGPVCVAMIINSFSYQSVTPVEMADWSAENGCYARQSGSYHSLIPKSLSAFGLQVDSVTDRTVEESTRLLRSGHILVALMGKGSLTQNGHFIIIAQLAPSGNVYIADPASYENSTKEWDLQLLMDELKRSYDSGGPLWAVSFPSKEEGVSDS